MVRPVCHRILGAEFPLKRMRPLSTSKVLPIRRNPSFVRAVGATQTKGGGNMPTSPTYPGVYIEEITSGVHTITGVSTSVAAFVDRFREGPVDEPIQITSFAEFSRIFGGLDNNSEASYAIQQFFLNGGNQAYVVRVGNNLTTAAFDTDSVVIVRARNGGLWGNHVRITIDAENCSSHDRFNLTITRYNGAGGDAIPLTTEKYLDLSVESNDDRSIFKLASSSKLIEIVVPGETFPVPQANGLTSGILADTVTLTDGGTLSVQIGSVSADAVVAVPGEITGIEKVRETLELAIRNAHHSPLFSRARVSIFPGESGQYHLNITAGRPASDYSPETTITITNIDGDIADSLLLTGESAAMEYALTEGSDGDPLNATGIFGQRSAEPFTGMYALENADLFNILCIPATAGLDSGGMDSVISRALAFCAEKRAVMIIDIPSDIKTVSGMKGWMEGKGLYRESNAITYFPRLEIPDPLDSNRLRNVGTSGTMAGVYSRIDTERGVWKAPAGIEAKLKGVTALAIEREMTDGQNGVLNPLGINCLRTFPLNGVTSWGGRTLVGADALASEWKYIPIRRLALFLEESLFRGTKWVVFEPNDEPLWARIRMNIGAFMMGLFKQGAFQGSTPDKAFFVKCDAETTTEADKNLGIINIEVGFAPLKPAEFVIIKIQQIAGEL